MRAVRDDHPLRILHAEHRGQPCGHGLARPARAFRGMEVLQLGVARVLRQARHQSRERVEVFGGGGPVHAQVDQAGIALRRGHERQFLRAAGDDRAAAGPAGHHAAPLQRGEGARDRREVDAQHARELALRRQAIAGLQLAPRDTALDFVGQLLVDRAAVIGGAKVGEWLHVVSLV